MALARRFLHVNLNCDSLDATEDLYGRQLGLTARMRTDANVATDGSILGLDGETFCETSFLYDSRGGRGGCALEAIEYRSPALKRDISTDPVRPGIRSAMLTVRDLESTAAALGGAGMQVGTPVEGLISGAKSVLVTDPDGVVIELAEGADDGNVVGALFSGIRIAAIDAVATGKFLTAIGFTEMDAPKPMSVEAQRLSPAGGSDSADCTVAHYGLAEDGDQFRLTVVQHPDTANSPVPWGGNRQGLYRCALRVESVEEALASVPDFVERCGDPVWCPLPGTKIEGLFIAFLRSPDGVVFEFVERPLKYFSR